MVKIPLFFERSFSQSKMYIFRVNKKIVQKEAQEFYANSTTLSSYLWEVKKRKNAAPALKWEVLRTAKTYSNITIRCSLCLHEKLAIISYPHPDELLNKRSELVTKYIHDNKFLLKNFNSND